MEDAKLFNLLRNDPSVGMEKLMDQYAGLVYTVVRGKMAGASYYSSDIEDCVADVFSEFFRSLDRYDPNRGSIKTYLCQIARHNAIDLLRKNDKYKEQISLEDGELLLYVADPQSVEESILQEEPLWIV